MNHVIEFFSRITDSADWPARWHCGNWTEFHGWLYIISDLLIWSAYFTIPAVILKYIRKKQDLRFIRLYFLFAAFILSCGITHFLDALAFWIPVYRLNGLMLLITGIISWITVYYLVQFLPSAFSLKSQTQLELEILQRTKAEEKFRNLLEAGPDAMVIIDGMGEIVLVNQQTELIFGYARKEIVGKPVDLLIPDSHQQPDYGSIFSEYGTAPHAGSLLELNARRSDGTIFPAEIRFCPLITEEATLLSASIRDISERKSEENKLSKARMDFQLLVTSVQDYAIVMLDKQGRIASWNSGAEHIKGYKEHEILGKSIEIFYTDDQIKKGEPAGHLEMAFHHGHFETEGWRIRKDGSGFFANIVITTLKDEKGKFSGFVKVTKDITERKKNEQALSDQNSNLEKMVADRTEELDKLNVDLEKKVRIRTAELMAANQEMEAFTYSVSHDLRAPLRSIIGFTSILEEEYCQQLDEEARRISKIITNNTIKMGCLIDGLLEFSRVGKEEMTRTWVDSRKMVSEVIAEQTLGNPGNNIDWRLQNLPPVLANTAALRQVWANLLGNAIKYSSKKEHPVIEIGCVSSEETLSFYVKDNGVGFDNNYKDQIFKVFQRLHSSDDFEGSGVGLALVLKIISKHGGNAWAEGEDGKGACFYFSLPIQNLKKILI